MIAFAWFGAGVLLGALIASYYYRRHLVGLVQELEASRARLQGAVNNQPKE